VDFFFHPRAVLANHSHSTPFLPPQAVVQFDPVLTSPHGGSGTGKVRHRDVTVSVVHDSSTPFFVDLTSQVDSEVTYTVFPPTPAPTSSLRATFSLSGTVTEDLFAPGSPSPLWVINSTVTVTGSLSGAIDSSGPTETITFVYGELEIQYQAQTPGAGGQAWTSVTTVATNGSLNEILWPPGPCFGLFTMHDEIHQTLAPVVPPGSPPGPNTRIDAVFNGAGIFDGNLIPPESTTLVGTVLLTGQLHETITLPPPSPTAPPPPPETLTFDILSADLFAEVLLNPVP
jgi:hypothetical protein